MTQAITENRIAMTLLLEEETRATLWRRVVEAIEQHTNDIRSLPVTPDLNPRLVRARLEDIDFDTPVSPLEAVEFAFKLLSEQQTHTTHPAYFGLFDPAPTTMGVIGETLAAVFNSQLAAWMQSPAAVEVEQLLVRAFGEKFGYPGGAIDGTFTSGGAEANHTALLTALTHHFPEFLQTGARGLAAQPVIYLSEEGHHSLVKAAKMCGLGAQAVHAIAVDEHLRLDVSKLTEQIAADRAAGRLPLFLVATAGTTSSGALDRLSELAELARRENLWLHVDAAWGGAAALVPEMRPLLAGIERADSITFDPHKWLSVPRGAGLYLTRHANILTDTFQVSTVYVPKLDTGEATVIHPFSHSMQWSRRFMGLKLFLSLAVTGWQGYAEVIRQNVELSRYLCELLEASDWSVINDPALAVVCFVDRSHPGGRAEDFLQAVCEAVIQSGQAWISVTRLANRIPALRACVVNYRTTHDDVERLVQTLNVARRKVASRYLKNPSE